MKFNEEKPIFIQIYESFLYDLFLSKIKPAEKLPSVRDIAKDFKVNPNTVTKAVDELIASGLFEIKRGIGTFVIEDELMIKKHREKFIENKIDETILEFKNMGVNKDELITMIEENYNGNDTKSK